MGPPFGRRTAEKRLELKIYMGYTMAHEFGEHIPELLGHRVAHIRAVSQPFLSQHLRFIVPTSKYLFIVAFPKCLEIVGHGHLSESAVFDRFSHIWRTLGLQVTFQSARVARAGRLLLF